jgi:hypothetical protein
MQYCRKIFALLASQTFLFKIRHFSLLFGEEVFGVLSPVSYTGYKAWPYSLHSVQTLREKRNEAISLYEHTQISCLGTK